MDQSVGLIIQPCAVSPEVCDRSGSEGGRMGRMKEKLHQQKVVFLCGLEMPLKVGKEEVKGGNGEVNLHWSRAWRYKRM